MNGFQVKRFTGPVSLKEFEKHATLIYHEATCKSFIPLIVSIQKIELRVFKQTIIISLRALPLPPRLLTSVFKYIEILRLVLKLRYYRTTKRKLMRSNKIISISRLPSGSSKFNDWSYLVPPYNLFVFTENNQHVYLDKINLHGLYTSKQLKKLGCLYEGTTKALHYDTLVALIHSVTWAFQALGFSLVLTQGNSTCGATAHLQIHTGRQHLVVLATPGFSRCTNGSLAWGAPDFKVVNTAGFQRVTQFPQLFSGGLSRRGRKLGLFAALWLHPHNENMVNPEYLIGGVHSFKLMKRFACGRNQGRIIPLRALIVRGVFLHGQLDRMHTSSVFVMFKVNNVDC
ncbi:hypothetical protein VP01_3688g1 [Puccinia sorghi]|uniref:Uncharacterized protein n=1 Tax=Puccinia sorghi TaxID=27349 RepID=A0A0L6UV19_9BASI|nr:hypothetical protein VP01_3688g1 [Puccinia sorghi]